jgi:UDPglucose 6-dehydrogenase
VKDNTEPVHVVIGAGYVGLATAAALRATGRIVRVYDANHLRIDHHRHCLADGENPLDEPLLGPALRDVEFVHHAPIEDAVVYVCVGTPALGLSETGKLGLDCSSAFAVAMSALEQGAARVIVRSTLTPSAASEIAALDPRRIAIVPEFLREGHATADALRPSRLVVGIGAAFEKGAEEVYDWLVPQVEPDPPILHVMRPSEACLVKLGSNAMLSLRAWFADALADACEGLPGTDARRVLLAIGADERIGPHHLQPGLGVAGPCLPKDLGALVDEVPSFGPLAKIHEQMDTEQVSRLAARIRKADASGAVLIVGVGFKPDSSDWRNSPVIELAIALSKDRVVTICEGRMTELEETALRAYLRERCDGEGTIPIVTRIPCVGSADAAVVIARHLPLDSSTWPAILSASRPETLLVDPYRLVLGAHLEEWARQHDPGTYIGRGLGPSR